VFVPLGDTTTPSTSPASMAIGLASVNVAIAGAFAGTFWLSVPTIW
jgi:hypothetical protein